MLFVVDAGVALRKEDILVTIISLMEMGDQTLSLFCGISGLRKFKDDSSDSISFCPTVRHHFERRYR